MTAMNDDSTNEPVDRHVDRIAASVGLLAELGQAPIAEHADAYQHIHSQLQALLAEIDS